MNNKTVQSKMTYNKMARDYEISPEGRYTSNHKKELIKKVIINDGDTILDVACGNGFLLNELSKKAKVKAYGIDISENMIKIAGEKYPNCTFLSKDCYPLDFESESVDVITVSCAFHHFEKPQEFANECIRILKAEGMIYMAEPYFQPLIRWIANSIVFPFTNSGDVKIYSSKNLNTIFRKAGFTDIETYVKGTIQFFTGRKNRYQT